MSVEIVQEEKVKEVAEAYETKVIEVMKGGKLRPVKVREVIIDWEGKPASVLIKKMSFGERAEYTEKFVKVRVVGELSETNIDMQEMQIQTLLMTIHQAPFPVSEDYIRWELDGQIGERIYKAAEDFNKINAESKKN